MLLTHTATALALVACGAYNAPTASRLGGVVHHQATASRHAPPRLVDAPREPVQATPSLADLVSASGEQLAKNGQQRPRRAAVKRKPPDEPTTILSRTPPPPSTEERPATATTRAWLLLCKDAMSDQLSLELAMRVSTAMRLLASRGAPDILTFCGDADVCTPPGGATRATASETPPSAESAGDDASPAGRLCSASLCYHYFRSAASAQSLDVSSTRFIIEERKGAREGVLASVVAIRKAQRQAAATKLHRASKATNSSRVSGSDGDGGDAPPSVEFTVITTDHLLHRLSDIEALTPGQSLLAPVRELDAAVRFVPAASPYTYSPCADAKRQAQHMRLRGQLHVVLVNLRGVEAHTDFWHSDNARRLSDVRAALNEELWELMPRHSGEKAIFSPLSHGHGSASGASAERGQTDASGVRLATGGSGALCELQCVEAAVAAVGKARAQLSELIANPLGGCEAQALARAMDELRAASASLHLADPDRVLSAEEAYELLRGRLEEHMKASHAVPAEGFD